VIVRSSSVPCYLQLAEIIRDNIQRGVYARGSQIPGEMELADRFDLNRHTVSKALQELVHEGLIYRTQGKGTFVSFPKVPYQMTRDSYFSRCIRSAHHEPRARLLDSREFGCGKELADALEVESGETVTELRILRSIGGVPSQFTITWLAAGRFPDITRHMGESFSLYGIMQQHYGIRPVRDEVTVEAGMPTQEDLELLQMPGQVPILCLRSVAREPAGAVVEISQHRGRSDMYRLIFDFGDGRTDLRLAGDQ
jgi:phosphonate metabolism transcriptional regulator PhnF